MIAVRSQLVMLFQHFIQIERPVQRKVHFSFGKLLYRNAHAVHHGLQNIQRPGFLQTDKISAFQAVVFLFPPIAVQKGRQLLQGHIVGGDRKVHQVAFHPDADLDGRHFADLLPAEGFGSLHLSVLQKGVCSLCQHAEHLVGAAVGAPGFLLFAVLRKEVMHLLQRVLLLVQIPVGRQGKLPRLRKPQRMLLVPVVHLRPAQKLSVLRVHPENKLRLRRQMLLYLLLIGNPDIQTGIFLQLRQHAIEKFRHFLLADLHLGNPILIRHFQQRLQLPELFLRDACHDITVQQVIFLFPLQELRDIRLQQNSVKILPLARSRNHNRNRDSCLPDFQLLEHGGIPAGHRHILPKLLGIKTIQPAAGKDNPVLDKQIPAAEIVDLLTHHLVHQLLSQTDLAPYQAVEGQRTVHKGVRGKGDRAFGSQLQRLVLLHLIHQISHILQNIHFGIPDLKGQLQTGVFHKNPRFQNNRLFTISALLLFFDCALSSDSVQELCRRYIRGIPRIIQEQIAIRVNDCRHRVGAEPRRVAVVVRIVIPPVAAGALQNGNCVFGKLQFYVAGFSALLLNPVNHVPVKAGLVPLPDGIEKFPVIRRYFPTVDLLHGIFYTVRTDCIILQKRDKIKIQFFSVRRIQRVPRTQDFRLLRFFLPQRRNALVFICLPLKQNSCHMLADTPIPGRFTVAPSGQFFIPVPDSHLVISSVCNPGNGRIICPAEPQNPFLLIKIQPLF